MKTKTTTAKRPKSKTKAAQDACYPAIRYQARTRNAADYVEPQTRIITMGQLKEFCRKHPEIKMDLSSPHL